MRHAKRLSGSELIVISVVVFVVLVVVVFLFVANPFKSMERTALGEYVKCSGCVDDEEGQSAVVGGSVSYMSYDSVSRQCVEKVVSDSCLNDMIANDVYCDRGRPKRVQLECPSGTFCDAFAGYCVPGTRSQSTYQSEAPENPTSTLTDLPKERRGCAINVIKTYNDWSQPREGLIYFRKIGNYLYGISGNSDDYVTYDVSNPADIKLAYSSNFNLFCGDSPSLGLVGMPFENDNMVPIPNKCAYTHLFDIQLKPLLDGGAKYVRVHNLQREAVAVVNGNRYLFTSCAYGLCYVKANNADLKGDYDAGQPELGSSLDVINTNIGRRLIHSILAFSYNNKVYLLVGSTADTIAMFDITNFPNSITKVFEKKYYNVGGDCLRFKNGKIYALLSQCKETNCEGFTGPGLYVMDMSGKILNKYVPDQNKVVFTPFASLDVDDKYAYISGVDFKTSSGQFYHYLFDVVDLESMNSLIPQEFIDNSNTNNRGASIGTITGIKEGTNIYIITSPDPSVYLLNCG